MKVTNIKVTLTNTPKVKAIVTIVIDNELEISDIRIVEDNNRIIIAFPNRLNTKTGKFIDIAHPINSNTRNDFSDVIMKEYYRKKKLLQNI